MPAARATLVQPLEQPPDEEDAACTAEPRCPAGNGTVVQGDGVARGTLPTLLLAGTRKVCGGAPAAAHTRPLTARAPA